MTGGGMTGRSGFLTAGHTPTLIAALLYFDVSFMAWVLLGPIAPFLREGFQVAAVLGGSGGVGLECEQAAAATKRSDATRVFALMVEMEPENAVARSP